jgi:thiol-disulfide isomerase/thioredoxin
MAFTESTMMELGTEAPRFLLIEPLTGLVRLSDELMTGKAQVVLFWCNHCPYVIYIEQAMLQLAREMQVLGVMFIAIGSNDADNYPDDAPDKMAERAKALNYPFVYLQDADQSVARAYDAACTPDIFVFDADKKLVYRGRFDDAKPKNDNLITGRDLRQALEAVLNGDTPNPKQYPSGGCNIKWKN